MLAVVGPQTERTTAAAEDAFDEPWYLSTYPVVQRDLDEGRADDPLDHYRRLGRHRGYLPHARAGRPNSAATHRGRFGGLWTDMTNALDLLEGRRRLGWIDDRQHALIQHFIQHGYVVIKEALPPAILDPAREAIEAAFDGRDPGQNFLSDTLGTSWQGDHPGLKAYPVKANEIHTRSAAIRDASFAPAITEFLTLIFERPLLLSQTLGFYRGSAQAVHQDSAYVAYSLATQFAASWIALEDVSANAGELCYYPGSHTFDDHLFFGKFKGVGEANRHLEENGAHADSGAFERSLPAQAAVRGLQLETFMAKAGDVLIWAADLAHGGRPVSQDRSRKSLVSHYCPAEVAPGYFEERADRQVRRHESGHFYSTWLDFMPEEEASPAMEEAEPAAVAEAEPPPAVEAATSRSWLDRMLRRGSKGEAS